MSVKGEKLTFEQAYPEAIAKVATFIQKQKEIASFEFAFMLNHGIIQKVKQAEFMKPPPRIIARQDLDSEPEDQKYKEEISTGASDTESEDHGSETSDIHSQEVKLKINTISKVRLEEDLAVCLEQLRSKRAQAKIAVSGFIFEKFACITRQMLELFFETSKRSSRTNRADTSVAIMLLSAREAKLPRLAMLQLISSYLNTDKVSMKIRQVRRSRGYLALVRQVRQHRHRILVSLHALSGEEVFSL
jgi:hypothetical protein